MNFTYLWSLKYDTDGRSYELGLTHIENRLLLARRRRRGKDWESGISRGNLLYTE